MIYEFKNIETGEVKEYSMRLSELDQFIEDHPELVQVIGATPLSYSGAGFHLKVDDGFKEVISRTEERLGKKVHRSGKW